MMTAEEKKEYFRAYYQNNKSKWLVYKDKWIKSNPEKNRQSKLKYRLRNKDAIRAYNKRWSQNNAGRVTAYSRAYQLAKARAMPKWLSPDQVADINAFYSSRPDDYHVDHVVPLNGKNVCGLHVRWNLQYLPASENIRKSNK